jgi:hypothetical protein
VCVVGGKYGGWAPYTQVLGGLDMYPDTVKRERERRRGREREGERKRVKERMMGKRKSVCV